MVAVVPEPDLLSIGHDDYSGIENVNFNSLIQTRKKVLSQNYYWS